MPEREDFPRSARLTSRKEFDAVFKGGDKLVGRSFVCYVLRQDGKGCKLGLAVSRKVGKATVRNRIKRYTREFFRRRRNEFQTDVDVVVVARPAAARCTFSETDDALSRLLQRGGILNG